MYDRNRNSWDVALLYLSLSIYPFSVILAAVLRLLSLDFFASKTIFLGYGLVALVAFFILLRFPVSLKRLSSLFFVYLVYVFLFLTSHQSVQGRYLDSDMVMIYSFYLPYAMLILSRISDFSPLFDNKIIDSINSFLIIGSFLVKFILKDATGYMTFSYNLLPFWILTSFSFLKKPTLIKLGVLLVMLVEGVVYGARGPLIWLVISILVFYILQRFDNQKPITISMRSLFTVTGIGLGLVLFVIVLFQILTRLNVANSYILNRAATGVLTQSTGRDNMIKIALTYLKGMGVDFNGMFFDRTIMPDGVYVHNLFLETFLSFGWLLGSLIILGLFYFIGKTFFKADIIGKKVVVFLTSSFFLKYFLTGSIYDDYTFIIYLTLMYAVYKQSHPDKLVIYDKKR